MQLSWAEEPEEPEEETAPDEALPPEDASSWATVDKPGFAPSGSQAAAGPLRLPASFGAARPLAEGDGYDFAEDLVKVTVSTLQNGQWVPGTDFQNGDSVQVTINYTIPTGVVGGENKTIYYQMPEGISLAEETGGTVYDGGIPVGTYTITTGGRITITFNGEFADERPFTGQIQFQGKVWANEDGGDNTIDFGAAGSITVKPNPDPTDVLADKTGRYDEQDKKLHYTLTVSTTKGTGGSITVTDHFNGGVHADYDPGSFHIVKVDKNGGRQEIPGYPPNFTASDWNPNYEMFTITGLPALAAGERYEITYTATPTLPQGGNGEANVINNLKVETGGGSEANAYLDLKISGKLIAKWGNADSSGKVTWTIRVNEAQRDIGGWTLRDTMTVDGQQVDLPATVAISPAVKGQSQISLPYTFPADSRETYTITYETWVEDLAPGQSATVYNEAELVWDGGHYESGSTVYPTAPGYGVTKGGWLDTNQSTETTGKVQWTASISVPNALTGQTLGQITYTDTLHGAATGGNPVADSHYITGVQLGAMTVKVDEIALVRGTDYIICDADGEQISDFSEDAHYTGFQIEFKEPAVDKVKGETISMQYYSTVDYTKLAGDIIYTIRNTGAIPGHKIDGSVTYEKPSRLEKQASEKEWQSGTGGVNNGYKDNLTVDYDASGGILHYRILLMTSAELNGQDIILTDRLPKGAQLVEGSVHAVYRAWGNDWYQWGDIPVSVQSSAPDADGAATVTFTINNFSYNADLPAVAVYYDVSIAEDSIWTDNPGLENHTYHNEVTWGSESAGTDVTVERDVPELAKTGAQLPQYDANGEPIKDAQGNPLLSNTVRYYVTINQGGKDLDPVRDVLELKDVLILPGNVAGAALNVDSVCLYRHPQDRRTRGDKEGQGGE